MYHPIMLSLIIVTVLAGAATEAGWPQKGDKAYVSVALGTLVPVEWKDRLRARDENRLKCDTAIYCTYRHPICEELAIKEIRPSEEGLAAWEGEVELCAFQDRDAAGHGICFRFRDSWRLVTYRDKEACSEVLAGIIGDAFADALVNSRKKRPLPFRVRFDAFGVYHIEPTEPKAPETEEPPK